MTEYKDYIICEAHTDEYDGFLICLNHEGILSYLNLIEKEPLIKNKEGKLLVDQLLVTGNGKNRFLLCDFNHGVLDLSSAEPAEPDATYRDRAVNLLKEHYHLLENTILSDLERDYIKKGRSF